jgi:hypothetical protein
MGEWMRSQSWLAVEFQRAIEGARQRASRRSAAADRHAMDRWCEQEPMGTAGCGRGKRGEEKEGDDMWGPHVSEWREM